MASGIDGELSVIRGFWNQEWRKLLKSWLILLVTTCAALLQFIQKTSHIPFN